VSAQESFAKLVELVARLRAPDGCPWDRAQTHESLKGMLIEEAYETVEAIERGDPGALQDELGDLLLHVVFHAQIAREAGEFTIEDIIERLNEKLIRRHPHVFSGRKVADPQEILENWEEIKLREGRRFRASALPALVEARKAQERGTRLGVEPPKTVELRALLRSLSGSAPEPEEALGELLFQVVALARELGVEPELALKRRTARFLEELEEVTSSGSSSGSSSGLGSSSSPSPDVPSGERKKR